MYELVDRGEICGVDGVEMFCVRSAGRIFPVMPAGELDALSR
jgi:hypothetical protein